MSTDSEFPKVFSVDDVAGVFQCNRETVKRMLRRHELPGFKFGKSWFVRAKDLEELLALEVQSSGRLRRESQESR